MMLEPKDAVGKARTYLGEVLPDFAELDPKVDEMKLVNDKCWKITFYAYLSDEAKSETLADILRRRRIEKVVSIDSGDGSLISVENFPF